MAANHEHGSKPQVLLLYRQCMRVHVIANARFRDGCGSYEPTRPGPNVCAACGCHRSFHEKIMAELPANWAEISTNLAPASPMEARNLSPLVGPTAEGPIIRRKRITPEQNEAMREVAEANGWKMFREYSREEVERVCEEIGIERGKLKSWISNHRRKRRLTNENLA